MAHGIRTTTVEIDPLVHEYATTYFGLGANHTSVIEDAVAFAGRAGRDRYDFIVHDVFTGGAEPVDLFTHEFIIALKRLLKPDGAIAIVSSLFRIS
jgi:spermidine synthase